MENVMALKVWLVLIAAPCLVSWVLGETFGTWRTERPRLIDPAELAGIDTYFTEKRAHSSDGSEPVTSQEHTALASIASPNHLAAPRNDGPRGAIGRPPRPEYLEDDRRTVFDHMPSIVDLQEEAAAIRRDSRIWDDPELYRSLVEDMPATGRVLRHYERSVGKLQAELDVAASDYAGPEPFDEMLRISDAAPILPPERCCKAG